MEVQADECTDNHICKLLIIIHGADIHDTLAIH